MQILVYIDEEDKKLWSETMSQVQQLLKTEGGYPKTLELRKAFFEKMIDKYPVLRYKLLAINDTDGYIYRWATNQDFQKNNY